MINKIVLFYVDGFKNLSSLGKKLWLLIIIKLVVIFVVLKVFFFPTVDTVVEKQDQTDLYVNQLTKITNQKTQKEE